MLAANPLIKGSTTNPTLARNAGVRDYGNSAADCSPPCRIARFRSKSSPMILSEWFAKRGRSRLGAKTSTSKYRSPTPTAEFSGDVISELSAEGIVVNVTAITTVDQVRRVAESLAPDAPAIVSVFAGRVADTGIDPVPVMAEALKVLRQRPNAELLWASPRELLNVSRPTPSAAHHHRKQRYPKQAQLGREGFGRVFTRDSKMSPTGCSGCRFRDRRSIADKASAQWLNAALRPHGHARVARRWAGAAGCMLRIVGSLRSGVAPKSEDASARTVFDKQEP